MIDDWQHEMSMPRVGATICGTAFRSVHGLACGLSVAFAFAAIVATAMPTRQQLAETQKFVDDLIAADISAVNAKQKTPGEVADAHLALVARAETEAGRYLLLQNAFRLYVRGGDYDAAAGVIRRMKKDVSDLPPEVIVELVSGEMGRVAGSKAPKVLAIFKEAKRAIKYRKYLATAEAEAKKHGTSKALRWVAECHGCLGEWKKALEIFARLRVVAAKWELDPESVPDCDAFKAAEYWWNYQAEDAEPFRAHAATLYRVALNNGLLTGLRAEAIKKRIETFSDAEAKPDVTDTVKKGQRSISNGLNPSRGYTLQLTNGIDVVFCAIPAGTFQMSNAEGSGTHKVTISRPFWITRTFVTVQEIRVLAPQKERDDAMSAASSMFREYDVAPGMLYSGDCDKICKQLNDRFSDLLPNGYVFRLPTEAELEFVVTQGGSQKVQYSNFAQIAEKESKARGATVDAGLGLIPRQAVNGWGIFGGLAERNHVFDKVNATLFKFPKEGNIRVPYVGPNGVARKLSYAVEEIDPVRCGKYHIMRYGASTRVIGIGKLMRGYARIVIAPKELNVYPQKK